MFARKTSPFVPHILRKCLSAIGFAPFRHVFAPFRHGGKVQNLWRNVMAECTDGGKTLHSSRALTAVSSTSCTQVVGHMMPS